jgi:hypothetical protein
MITIQKLHTKTTTLTNLIYVIKGHNPLTQFYAQFRENQVIQTPISEPGHKTVLCLGFHINMVGSMNVMLYNKNGDILTNLYNIDKHLRTVTELWLL